MTANQLNRLSMYLAVLGVMETFHGIWQSFTAIADMVARLGAVTRRIADNSGVQGTPRTGIAEGKNRAQMAMIEAAASIAGDLHSLAMKNGDTELAAKTNFFKSDLTSLQDAAVGPRCREIQVLATANMAALAAYGVEPGDIGNLDGLINDYEPKVAKPRQATAESMAVTAAIKEDDALCDAILKDELDRSMRKFKEKNPDFYNAYTSARQIVDLGSRKKTAKPVEPRPA